MLSELMATVLCQKLHEQTKAMTCLITAVKKILKEVVHVLPIICPAEKVDDGLVSMDYL